jgi:hypothetical protein
VRGREEGRKREGGRERERERKRETWIVHESPRRGPHTQIQAHKYTDRYMSVAVVFLIYNMRLVVKISSIF